MYNPLSDSSNSAPAVQGFAPDETSLRSGWVAPSQKTPLWGGMAVTVSLGLSSSLGPVLLLATAASNIGGFTALNQSDAMNTSVENSVPQARAGDGTKAGGAINFFLLRSRGRIWVKCSKDAVADLDGGSITPTVYWDFRDQRLITRANDSPLSVIVLRVTENAQVVTRGGSWDYSGCAALIQI